MGYSVEPEAVRVSLDFPFQSHINSGLGLIHKASYDLDDFERWLEIPEILGHPHRIEQTLVALASSKFGHEFLPEEYDVLAQGTRANEIVKHYTGPIRYLMYREGLGARGRVDWQALIMAFDATAHEFPRLVIMAGIAGRHAWAQTRRQNEGAHEIAICQ